jgi:hypothetical protein
MEELVSNPVLTIEIEELELREAPGVTHYYPPDPC